MGALSPDMEGRLIRLEENCYFLEEQLKALDRQITAQQAQLDTLEQELKQAGAQLKDIRDILSEAHGTGDEIPPHHVPSRW